MPDRPSFEETLRVLGEAVADLSRRVSALEHAAGALPAPPEPASVASVTASAPVPPASVPASAPPLSAPDLVGVLSLIGRTLIVFGGAYLLRALTESGRVPAATGIALGLVYAVTWYGAADYAAGTRRRLSSLFHGTAAVVISLPLIWEASTRFQFLSPVTSALAVLLVTGAALAVAWHRRLQTLAAVALAAGIVTSVALASATLHVLPFAAALVAIGIGALWQSDALGWMWLRWPAAVAADLLLLVLLARSTVDPPGEAPGSAVLLCVALFIAYAGSFAILQIGRGRRAGVFEFTQLAAAIFMGLTCATAIARAHLPGLVWEVGALGAVAGAASYVAAFSLVGRQGTSRHNFYFFGAGALALVLWSSATLETNGGLALILVISACVASWLSSRFGEPMALLHGAVFGTGAAIASGLLSVAGAIWLTPISVWPAYSAAAWLALASAAALLAVPSHTARAAGAVLGVIARVTFATVVVAGAGTALVLAVGPVLAGSPPGAGGLASLKTVVVACGAMLLARASRVPRVAEAGWLAYPVLAFGALKLFLEDFRYSQPSTLFLALAIYGVALIAVPRLMRKPA